MGLGVYYGQAWFVFSQILCPAYDFQSVKQI